jgi:hypothetical protein
MVRPHCRRTGYALPDIFDEVQEDLRAERASSLARRFGGLAAAGVVAVLGGTGAYVWWGQQQQAAADATATRFIAAGKMADTADQALSGLDRSAASQAAANFADIAAHGPAGYRVLAKLRLAALQWELGQAQQAIATWKSVTDDTGAPALLRDLATVTSAQHQVDSADPVLLKQTMEGLTSPENPWRPMAQQIIAVIDIRLGKMREAADIMKRLEADPVAPEGIRQMVADLMTTLPPDALAPLPAPISPVSPHGAAAVKPPRPPQAAGPAKPAPHG